MKSYICINGKKAELTEEQIKALGIELPKSCTFDRVRPHGKYYMIDPYGRISEEYETKHNLDEVAFNIANYCTDKGILEQRALHETLNRLLWRYSMEHGAEEINWEDREQQKWEICYNHSKGKIEVFSYETFQALGSVYFASYQTAWDAIEEIIKPFIKEHPDFKW